MKFLLDEKDNVESVLAIKKDGTVDVSTFKNNKTSTKTVFFRDMMTAMAKMGASSSLYEEDIPPNCFKIIKKGQRSVYFFHLKEFVYPKITVRGCEIKDIVVPACMMAVAVDRREDGSLSLYKTFLFAIDGKTRKIKKDTMLQEWPFSNYSPTYSTGVCWGGKEMVRRLENLISEDIGVMDSLLYFYLDMDFNYDLIRRFSPDSFYRLSIHTEESDSLLEKTSPRFPNGENIRSFESFVNSII